MLISYLCNIIHSFQTAYFGGGKNDVFSPTIYYSAPQDRRPCVLTRCETQLSAEFMISLLSPYGNQESRYRNWSTRSTTT